MQSNDIFQDSFAIKNQYWAKRTKIQEQRTQKITVLSKSYLQKRNSVRYWLRYHYTSRIWFILIKALIPGFCCIQVATCIFCSDSNQISSCITTFQTLLKEIFYTFSSEIFWYIDWNWLVLIPILICFVAQQNFPNKTKFSGNNTYL